MAMGSSVPPRAYTREILTTAFNWLQSQPDSVRSKATTPDALVGLYMQAQRGGASAQTLEAEAPQSAQAFMSDLKNLAEGLKEFDDSRSVKIVTPPASARAQLGNPQTATLSAPAVSPPPVASSTVSSTAVSMAASMTLGRVQKSIPLEDNDSAPVSVAPSSGGAEAGRTYAGASASGSAPAPASASGSALGPGVSAPLMSGLNEKSVQMLREVQMALNLTSDLEAMNMMIAIAHKNLKSLL